MSGSFAIVRVAASGMYTSQAALNVTSGNISNSGVSAYTRQAAVMSDTSTTSTINGTDLAEIQQIRDSYLDSSYRKEAGQAGYWDYLSGITTQIDALGGYDDDTGLCTVAEEFFSAWEEAGKAPEDSATRSAVVETGTTLVETLTTLSEGLASIREQVESDVEDSVDTVNQLSGEISTLIGQIRTASAAGKDTTDLEDQLNTALDSLSEYGNVKVRQGDDGTEVYFGNELLVDSDTVRTLAIDRDADGINGVLWASTGGAVFLNSGSLKAQLELLAPAEAGVSFSTETTGLLEAYENTLEAYTTGLTEAVNTVHAAAYDLEGNLSGLDFFTAADSGQPLSAGNLRVNTALDDTDSLACSAAGQSGDGDAALSIAALLDSDIITTTDGDTVTVSSFQSSLAEWTGFIGDTATTNLDTQNAVVEQITTERTSVTGVSLDEELTRMIAYQQAYSANAQILSIVSDLLDTIINDMKG